MTQHTTQPSLYKDNGRIDITARRNAMVARMQDDGTGKAIWNERME